MGQIRMRNPDSSDSKTHAEDWISRDDLEKVLTQDLREWLLEAGLPLTYHVALHRSPNPSKSGFLHWQHACWIN